MAELTMNEVIKITTKGIPNPKISQLPLPLARPGEPLQKAYPPEFWIEVPTSLQQELIREFEKHQLDYMIYEIIDSYPPVSKAVCRSWLQYEVAQNIMLEICNGLLLDGFVVSDGSLTSINTNGDLLCFISFD